MASNGMSDEKEPLKGENNENAVLNGVDEEDDDSQALLLPKRGGLSKKLVKSTRKVQWNDNNGNKLTEVLEFQPSDASESDDEDSDSCFCTIM